MNNINNFSTNNPCSNPKMSFSFWKQPFKQSLQRSLTILIAFKIFEHSLAVCQNSSKFGLLGITLSIVPLIISRKQFIDSKNDFSKMELTTKIVTIAIPILIGFIPIGLNSLFPILKPIDHVNFLAMSLNVHFALIPIFKHLQREIRACFIGQDKAFRRMKIERDSWRQVAFVLAFNQFAYYNKKDDASNASIPSNQQYHTYKTFNSNGLPIIIDEVI